ncbi:MAG: CopG family transcriptional regulator [Cyanobacteria bacterium J06623_7]
MSNSGFLPPPRGFLDSSQKKNIPHKNNDDKGKRMTIQFSSALIEHLEYLAETQGITQAEVVRRAVLLESYLRQALQEPDTRLLIEANDSIKEVIIR